VAALRQVRVVARRSSGGVCHGAVGERLEPGQAAWYRDYVGRVTVDCDDDQLIVFDDRG
jgi:hypothetical protein